MASAPVDLGHGRLEGNGIGHLVARRWITLANKFGASSFLVLKAIKSHGVREFGG